MRASRIAAVLVPWVAGLSLASPAAARDDWHFWHDEEIRLFAAGKYQASLYQTARYRNDVSEVYYIQGTLVNRWALSPSLAAAANYSYVQQKRTGNHWREEHRPEVELAGKFPWGRVRLEPRARAELRLIEGSAGEEEWRLRPRLQLAYPVGRFTLFAYDELFYSTPPDAWDQHRVFVGVTWAAHPRLSGTAAWGIQSVRSGNDWEDRQVLSLSLKMAF
jgi:hypothetical protein